MLRNDVPGGHAPCHQSMESRDAGYKSRRARSSRIPEMKQVELYCKWFEIFPLAYHIEVCPRPPDDVIDRVKNVKNKKRQSKRKAAEITQESSQSQGADFTQVSSQSEHDVDEREMDGHADMPDLSPIDEPEGLV